jgi:hypothetical protein
MTDPRFPDEEGAFTDPILMMSLFDRAVRLRVHADERVPGAVRRADRELT